MSPPDCHRNSPTTNVNENLSYDDFRHLLMPKLDQTDSSDHEDENVANDVHDTPFNASHLGINFSYSEAYDIFLKQKHDNRNLPYELEVILIVIYSVLIVTGLTANVLVSFVVARRAQMHTPRNLYIVNLTVSDITLCVIGMPFTLVFILRRQWTLGSFLCKIVPVVQGTNIMVSIGTITVIALDRYFTIVRRSSQNPSSNRRRVIISIVCIWTLSALATLPVFYYQVVEPVKVRTIILYHTCIEQWPSNNAKLTYSVCVLLLQSVIPVLVVGVVHARIVTYLHSHATAEVNSRRAKKELHRNRRTTLLLSCIAIIFAVSWLPLGIFLLYTDLILPDSSRQSPESLYAALAMCHITAMTSAISNPIVYGWLNSNIRNEFLQLLPASCAKYGSTNRRNIDEHPQDGVSGSAATAIEENATTRTHLNHGGTSINHNNLSMGGGTGGASESVALLVQSPLQLRGTVTTTRQQPGDHSLNGKDDVSIL